MPGVPPDALSQVKKGLKGLFSRRKKDRYQRTDNVAEGSSAGAFYTSPEPTTAGNEHHQTLTGAESSIPQIAEPVNVKQSKNIDLDPYGSSTRAVGTEPSAQVDDVAKLDAKPPAEGMSATSGPLSHDLTGIYGSPVASPTEDKQQGLPKWEGLRPVEAEGGAAEKVGVGHDIGSTERDAITQRLDIDKGLPKETVMGKIPTPGAKYEGEVVQGEAAD